MNRLQTIFPKEGNFYNRFSRAWSGITALAGILLLGYLVIFLRNGSKAFLGGMVCLSLAIVFLVFSRIYFAHEKILWANRLFLLATASVILNFVFLGENLVLYLIIFGLLSLWLLHDFLEMRIGRFLGFSIALTTGFILIIGRFTQPPGDSNASVFHSNLLLPILISILGVFAFWRFARLVKIESIQSRLFVNFIIVALLPVLLTGGITAFVDSRNIQTRVTNQLESVATLKEAEIQAWLEMLHLNLYNQLPNEAEQVHFDTVLTRESQPRIVFQYSHDLLLEQFGQSIARDQLFDEIFLLDLKGRVVLSTIPTQEGKSFFAQSIFQSGMKGWFVAPPIYSPLLHGYRILVAQPLSNTAGEQTGVIVGRANLERLNAILLERAGLGETGETYLVGSNYVLVTVLRNGERFLTSRTESVQNALNGYPSGSGTYLNPTRQEVVGVYHWIPELQVVLLAEQARQEAFHSVTVTAVTTLAVVIFSLVLAAVLAVLVTRGIAKPIQHLASVSAQIASGNLSLQVDVDREDEIGSLAVAFNRMASQLRELIGNLEERVSERTQALERRSMQLQVAAEVARDVISADNLFQLLNQAVNLIRNRFDFYHAGIFLVDDQSEFAVLQAATGEAGRHMLEQGHKLKIGSQGIVGTAISTGKAHIALDVGTDAVHFKNRLLPLTRSEIALPLRSGERVIGALDVQSQRPAAFDEDDITVLQTLADQLAIAIENTRLLQRMDQTVRELQQAYGTYTQETWKVYSQKMQKPLGYRFQQIDVFPVEEQRPEARQALLQGETVLQRVPGDAQEGTLSVLAVPIKLRNEVIGVLSLRFEGDDVPAETVALVEEAATRLGLVVENVRLLESAQNMAFREQQVNLISNQLRGSANVETVLQNTVRELGKALGVSRTFIALSSGWSEQATKQGNKPGRNHEKSLRPASGNGSKGNGKSREQ